VAFHLRHGPGASPQAAPESCAFGAQHGQLPLSSLECAQIVGHIWIFRRERFNIANFDVDFLYAGPFEFENRTSNIECPTPMGFASRHRIGSWTSNLKFLTTKIEQA
jgi:hypothetical protein